MVANDFRQLLMTLIIPLTISDTDQGILSRTYVKQERLYGVYV